MSEVEKEDLNGIYGELKDMNEKLTRSVTVQEGMLKQMEQTYKDLHHPENGIVSRVVKIETSGRWFKWAAVIDVGTYTGNNVSDIVIENTTSAQTLADIAPGIGQTQLTMFTVPAGETAYLERIFANVSSGKPVTLHFWQRQNADDTSTPFTGKRLIRPIKSTAGPQEYSVTDSSFPEKTDLWWSGFADSGTSAADVGYDLLLEVN